MQKVTLGVFDAIVFIVLLVVIVLLITAACIGNPIGLAVCSSLLAK